MCANVKTRCFCRFVIHLRQQLEKPWYEIQQGLKVVSWNSSWRSKSLFHNCYFVKNNYLNLKFFSFKYCKVLSLIWLGVLVKREYLFHFKVGFDSNGFIFYNFRELPSIEEKKRKGEPRGFFVHLIEVAGFTYSGITFWTMRTLKIYTKLWKELEIFCLNQN